MKMPQRFMKNVFSMKRCQKMYQKFQIQPSKNGLGDLGSGLLKATLGARPVLGLSTSPIQNFSSSIFTSHFIFDIFVLTLDIHIDLLSFQYTHHYELKTKLQQQRHKFSSLHACFCHQSHLFSHYDFFAIFVVLISISSTSP